MTVTIAALDPGASPTLALRDYQHDLDDRRRACPAHRRVVQSPTGSGKSKLIEAAAAEAEAAAAIPMGRYGSSAEVGELIAFLAGKRKQRQMNLFECLPYEEEVPL